MPKDDPYKGVWEEYMRRNAARKDYMDEKKKPASKFMSRPENPPNLQPEDYPDEPISPAFDPGLQANFRDKHNTYPRDHKFDNEAWNRVPDPVGPRDPPLHIPTTHKEMRQYWPFKNDQVMVFSLIFLLMLLLL